MSLGQQNKILNEMKGTTFRHDFFNKIAHNK